MDPSALVLVFGQFVSETYLRNGSQGRFTSSVEDPRVTKNTREPAVWNPTQYHRAKTRSMGAYEEIPSKSFGSYHDSGFFVRGQSKRTGLKDARCGNFYEPQSSTVVAGFEEI